MLGIAQIGTRCSLVRDGNSSVRDELLLSFTFGSDFAEILEFFLKIRGVYPTKYFDEI